MVQATRNSLSIKLKGVESHAYMNENVGKPQGFVEIIYWGSMQYFVWSSLF